MRTFKFHTQKALFTFRNLYPGFHNWTSKAGAEGRSHAARENARNILKTLYFS